MRTSFLESDQDRRHDQISCCPLKRKFDRVTMLVINISGEGISFSGRERERERDHGAARHSTERNRAASVGRVVASYQFNRFSMNGRIGFLKVPVSPGEPHFSIPPLWTYGVFSVCAAFTVAHIFAPWRALKLRAQLRVPASRKCILVRYCACSCNRLESGRKKLKARDKDGEVPRGKVEGKRPIKNEGKGEKERERKTRAKLQLLFVLFPAILFFFLFLFFFFARC